MPDTNPCRTIFSHFLRRFFDLYHGELLPRASGCREEGRGSPERGKAAKTDILLRGSCPDPSAPALLHPRCESLLGRWYLQDSVFDLILAGVPFMLIWMVDMDDEAGGFTRVLSATFPSSVISTILGVPTGEEKPSKCVNVFTLSISLTLGNVKPSHSSWFSV